MSVLSTLYRIVRTLFELKEQVLGVGFAGLASVYILGASITPAMRDGVEFVALLLALSIWFGSLQVFIKARVAGNDGDGQRWRGRSGLAIGILGTIALYVSHGAVKGALCAVIALVGFYMLWGPVKTIGRGIGSLFHPSAATE